MLTSRQTGVSITLALGLCSPAAHADLIPISQTRTVSGDAYASDDNGEDSEDASDSAPDFGPFVSAASANAEVGGAYSSGGGNQNSVISSTGIDARGAAFANAGGWSDNGFGDSSGRSRFDLRFEITEDTDFSIDVSFAVYDSGGLFFSFAGPNGRVIDVDIKHNYETYHYEEGTLTPGEYRLQMNASGSAFGDEFFKDYAFASYDVEIILDEGVVPEDVNGDGFVDFDDVLLILAAWGECDGCPEDVNGDGFVDFDDLLRVLAAWS